MKSAVNRKKIYTVLQKASTFVMNALSSVYYFGFVCKKSVYESGLFKPYKTTSARVISIGNISTGGCGKTPAAYHLARHYLEKGLKTGVVFRGYGGSLNGEVCEVLSGSILKSSAEISGDEPFLLGLKLRKYEKAVVVCARKRPLALQKCEESGCEVIILDDGLQRWDTGRDVNIVIIDYTTLGNRQYLLPAGRLREYSCEAMKRADLVLISRAELAASPNSADHAAKTLKKRFGKQVFLVRFEIAKLQRMEDWIENRLSWVETGRINSGNVLCAIGNPDSFVRSLEKTGIGVSDRFIFKDHHDLNREEFQSVLDKTGTGQLFVTEKDAVKLQKYADMIQCTGTEVFVAIQEVMMEGAVECLQKLLKI